MGFIDDWTFRLRNLLQLDSQEQELDEELRFHLEMDIEQRMAAGASRRDAERQARLAFGAPEAVKEACRDAWGTRLVDEMRRDVGAAFRALLKAPIFTSAVLCSLVLGLGAATVVFCLVDAVLLRPLPFEAPDRIVRFYELTKEGHRFSMSDPNFLDFEAQSELLSHVAASVFPAPTPALGQDGSRVKVRAEGVTDGFFDVFGVDAALGRVFSSSDATDGVQDPRLVVLTHLGWTRLFGADPEIVGRTVDLDGEAWTVIGVLPSAFRWADPKVQVFLPYRARAELSRGDHRLAGFARLAPGVDVEQADHEVKAVARRLAAAFPESNADWSAELVPIDEIFTLAEVRRTNWMLVGAVALLLLLSCVNVSNLVLVRAEERVHEMQLRRALGAGAGRLWRQIGTESLLMGCLGAAGAALAVALVLPWARHLEADLPRLDLMRFDLRAATFLGAATLLSCFVFGSAAALRTLSAPPGPSRSRRQGADLSTARVRNALVIVEVALATVLALGAGVLWRSFGALQGVDSGFRDTGVLLADIELPIERYEEGSPRTRQLYDQLIEGLAAYAAIEAVAVTTTRPFRGPQLQNYVAPEDETEQERFEHIHWRAVTAEYFQAMSIPMIRGRSLQTEGEQRLEILISTGLAERLWPGQDPLGRNLRWMGPQGPTAEVIGVVGDTQDLQLGEDPLPMVYMPQRGMGWPQMTLVVKSSGSREAVTEAIHGIVRELDPLLALPEVGTLVGQRAEALARPLFSLRLVGLAALIALCLALIGVYGIVAYGISRRRRERSLRLAVGARPGQVIGMVLRGSLRLTALGLGVGLALAIGLLDSIRSLLYETSPFEPRVAVSVVVALGLAGFLAGLVPALRAAAIDPVEALRQE